MISFPPLIVCRHYITMLQLRNTCFLMCNAMSLGVVVQTCDILEQTCGAIQNLLDQVRLLEFLTLACHCHIHLR